MYKIQKKASVENEEGEEVKQSPLAKCHLGICNTNLALSGADRAEFLHFGALQYASAIQEQSLVDM